MLLETYPFPKRTWTNLKDHKKKTIFLILVLVLMYRYDYYTKIIRYFRTMEPLRLKLRRWLLGEERYMPESVSETFIAAEGLKLRTETVTVLSELFARTDKDFIYGVDRKFLKKIYVKAGCLPDKKAKEDFYNEGPYRRKLNQRVSGVSLKQFLLLFERMLQKMQKKDPTFSEQELLRSILDAWEEAKTKTMQWEVKVLNIREELRKGRTVFEEDKKRIIWDKVKEDPTISFEEIEKILAETGFYGLSLKEKLLILQYQLMNYEVTKAYYASRLEKEVIPSKTIKIEGKIKSMEEKIQKYKNLIETHKLEFKDIYQRTPKEGEIDPNNPEASLEGKSDSESESKI